MTICNNKKCSLGECDQPETCAAYVPVITNADRCVNPSADVAPVRNGRWIEPLRLHYGAKQYECSLCYSDTFWRKHSITVKYPYCPNCGCRMDGGAD